MAGPIAILALLLLALLHPESVRSAPQRPVEYVESTLVAHDTISYVGEIENTRFGAHQAEAVILRVEHLAPDATRRTYLAPDAFAGRIMLTNGPMTAILDPARRVMILGEHFDPSRSITHRRLHLIIHGYRASFGATGQIAGRPVQEVVFANRRTNERALTMWIDTATHLLLAQETYGEHGALREEMRFRNIRYVTSLPVGLFILRTPRGYRTILRSPLMPPREGSLRDLTSLNFTPHMPHRLPDGFVLIGAARERLDSTMALHLFYADGIRSLSLFESEGYTLPAAHGERIHDTTFSTRSARIQAVTVDANGTHLLSWHSEHMTFTLVSDLNLETLTAIATSIEEHP